MKNPADLDRYIADLKKRQQHLFLQYDEVDSELDEITDQLQMAEAVRAQIQRHFRFIPQDVGVDEKLRLKFAHLTIKQMLVRIALEAGGILDLANARQILVRAGVFKDERNAATSMAPILSRHDETFKRVGRGVYILIGGPNLELPADICPPAITPYPVALFLGNTFDEAQPSCTYSDLLEGVRNSDT